jgi:hypothetical protein
VSTYNEKFQQRKKTKENSSLFETFNVLKSEFFHEFIAKPNEVDAAYQKWYGYTVFVKLLILLSTKKLEENVLATSKEDRKTAPKSIVKSENSKPAKATNVTFLPEEKRGGKRNSSSFTESETQSKKKSKKSASKAPCSDSNPSIVEFTDDMVPKWQNVARLLHGQILSHEERFGQKVSVSVFFHHVFHSCFFELFFQTFL